MDSFMPYAAALCLSLVLLRVAETPLAASEFVRARTPVGIPDIPGYRTLKCDFHIHTVFSDGSVWPDIRSEEAWREGLDAIAITDHIEYQPHKADLPTQHNRSFEIARPRGESLLVTVIRGSEITREMPPGHLNAIFLEDAQLLETDDWYDAVKAAYHQGAFIFWNHPGWTGQQSDGVARWYPEHDRLVNEGMLQGVEVVNGREYYPEAHRWCLEKNLTMLSNSDVHSPLNLDYDTHTEDHRPLTLVFAREDTAASIKEALFDRRTAAYSGSRLIGKERFLRPIFERSVQVRNPELVIRGKQRVYLQIRNSSEIEYRLALEQGPEEVALSRSVRVPAGKTALLSVRGKSTDLSETKDLTALYRVENLLVAPQEGLEIAISFQVRFLEK